MSLGHQFLLPHCSECQTQGAKQALTSEGCPRLTGTGGLRPPPLELQSPHDSSNTSPNCTEGSDRDAQGSYGRQTTMYIYTYVYVYEYNIIYTYIEMQCRYRFTCTYNMKNWESGGAASGTRPYLRLRSSQFSCHSSAAPCSTGESCR